MYKLIGSQTGVNFYEEPTIVEVDANGDVIRVVAKFGGPRWDEDVDADAESAYIGMLYSSEMIELLSLAAAVLPAGELNSRIGNLYETICTTSELQR